ncbi:MAG: cytochrome c peroxidase [Turneriella sp.]
MSNTKYNSLPGAKPHPAYGTPPLDKGRGRGWGLFLLLGTLLLSACVAQEDKEVLFSDTELAIIKTLIYQDMPDDPTSRWDQNAGAATLGQKFFWDKRFSGEILMQGNRTVGFSAGSYGTLTSGQINCATCHDPNFGWADGVTKPNNLSLGANFTDRNSPTILNTVANEWSLWDGAADSPWSLIRAPIEGGPHNFGRLGVAYLICTLYASEYDAVFDDNNLATGSFTSTLCNTGATANTTEIQDAYVNACNPVGGTAGSRNYGKPGQSCYDNLSTATPDTKGAVNTIFANFMKAIAAYERLIVSKNSSFDQWVAGNENAMTASQKRGLKVFIGKGNCIRCHSGSNFTDGKFHNLGVPQLLLVGSSYDEGRSTGISSKLLNTSSGNGFFSTASPYNDGTINRVTGLSAQTADVGAFKTPTLRSVSKTGPYFHNGTVNSLWDVVNFYNFAGNAGNFPGTKDSVLTTRRMTNEELEDLVNFLKALDGEALATTITTSPTLP